MLVNPLVADQSVTVMYTPEGAASFLRTYTVPGCGDLPLDLHDATLLGFPSTTKFFRVVVFFPGPGFAQITIHSLPTFGVAAPVLPPPQVLR